jgi:hypothetical protein
MSNLLDRFELDISLLRSSEFSQSTRFYRHLVPAGRGVSQILLFVFCGTLRLCDLA